LRWPRASRRGVPGAAGQGQASSVSGSSTIRPSARSCSPAPPRSAGDHGRLRPRVKRVTLELGGKSANTSSPMPTWNGPRPPPRRPPSTTPARTAAPGRGSWCSARSWRPSWSCSSPRSRPSRSATASAATVMGPLISAAHRDRGRVLRGRTGRRSRSAGTAPDGPGHWYPPTVLAAGPAGRPGLHRGGFRARGHRYPVRGRGDGGGARQ